MNCLDKHPYYQTYMVEVVALLKSKPIGYVIKDDLSDQAKEVWDYREELIVNGIYVSVVGNTVKL